MGMGLAVRLIVAMTFFGSDDITSQYLEAGHLLNHSPIYSSTGGSKLLLGYLVPALMLLFGSPMGLPPQFVLKLPAIAGDLIAAGVLKRINDRHPSSASSFELVAFYLLNPATIMLSAYHGSVDPLMAGLLLAAVLLSSEAMPRLAGLALGTAIAFKPLAILLLPVLVILAKPGRRTRTAVPALLVLAGVAIPFAISDPGFYRVFQNSSLYGTWGIPLLLKQSRNLAAAGLVESPISRMLDIANHLAATWGRYVLLAILIWWFVSLATHPPGRGFVSLNRAAAITFVMFYVFASGFGVQYLSLALPFLLLESRTLATAYVTAISPFLAGMYLYANLPHKYGVVSVSENLRVLGHADLALVVATAVFGLAAWATCVWILYRLLKSPPRAISV
jgi:hypothetical protein